jgi:hypothetical protein
MATPAQPVVCITLGWRRALLLFGAAAALTNVADRQRES